jgi:hypothetical protein
LRLGVSNAEQWATRFEEIGIEAQAKRADRLVLRLTPKDFTEHEDPIRELIHQCVSEFEA